MVAGEGECSEAALGQTAIRGRGCVVREGLRNRDVEAVRVHLRSARLNGRGKAIECGQECRAASAGSKRTTVKIHAGKLVRGETRLEKRGHRETAGIEVHRRLVWCSAAPVQVEAGAEIG